MGLTGGAGAGGSNPGMMSGAGAGGASAGGGVGTAGTAKDFNSLISGRGSGGGDPGAGTAGAAGNRLGGTPRGLGDGERTTTNQAAPAETKEKPPRYEFVVLFFWSEDVPSDKLMGFAAPDPTASSQQSSGGAGGGAGLPGKGAGK